MEVVGDLAHVPVQEPTPVCSEALGRSPAERSEHVGEGRLVGLGAVWPPYDHRHAAGLAFGDPADVVRRVLPRERHGLAKLADCIR